MIVELLRNPHGGMIIMLCAISAVSYENVLVETIYFPYTIPLSGSLDLFYRRVDVYSVSPISVLYLFKYYYLKMFDFGNTGSFEKFLHFEVGF